MIRISRLADFAVEDATAVKAPMDQENLRRTMTSNYVGMLCLLLGDVSSQQNHGKSEQIMTQPNEDNGLTSHFSCFTSPMDKPLCKSAVTESCDYAIMPWRDHAMV